MLLAAIRINEQTSMLNVETGGWQVKNARSGATRQSCSESYEHVLTVKYLTASKGSCVGDAQIH